MENLLSPSYSPRQALFRRNSAGIWARIFACLIDLAVLCCVHCWCLIMLLVAVSKSVPADVSGLLLLFVVILCYLVFFPPLLAMAYFTVFHACGGQTIGKMFMGIRVAAIDAPSISFGRAFLRWVGTVLSALPMAAGFLWVLLDERRQAWHDKLAGTKVVLVEMY